MTKSRKGISTSINDITVDDMHEALLGQNIEFKFINLKKGGKIIVVGSDTHTGRTRALRFINFRSFILWIHNILRLRQQ